MDYLELGSSPCDEDCVQVSKTEDYIPAMKLECRRYKQLLEKKFPIPENVKAWFSLKANQHDFGTYYEVAINFDENDQESCEFAYHVEDNLPANWEDLPLTENKQPDILVLFKELYNGN